jgi:hypothetical protein
MKRHLPLAALLIMALASLAFAQPQPSATPSPAARPKPRMSKAQLLRRLSASETKLWEGWKNKDPKPFQANLSADSILVGGSGVSGKADSIKGIIGGDCQVASYTLSDWKLTMIDSDAALLTYKGAAEGTCGGQPIPTNWASTVWVKRRGRWQAFTHQETPVMSQ